MEDGGNAWTIGEAREKNYPLKARSVTKGYDGPYWASVDVVIPVDDSEISITYRLAYDKPVIEIDIQLDWKEIGSEERGTPNLRMAFPLPFNESSGTYEIPYGALKRSENQGEEVPALRWANIDGQHMASRERAGMLLLNDCKYGHSLNGSTLKVSLIRSTFYPDPYPEPGLYHLRLALIPHGQEMSEPDYMKLASAFSQPIKVINTDIHPGGLPAISTDAILIKPENIILTAVKQAEDRDGIILRLIETTGENTTAIISLDETMFGNIKKASEVDLIERSTGRDSFVIDDNSIEVDVTAYGISTIKLIPQ
jgi:alpha-mannosidase